MPVVVWGTFFLLKKISKIPIQFHLPYQKAKLQEKRENTLHQVLPQQVLLLGMSLKPVYGIRTGGLGFAAILAQGIGHRTQKLSGNPLPPQRTVHKGMVDDGNPLPFRESHLRQQFSCFIRRKNPARFFAKLHHNHL